MTDLHTCPSCKGAGEFMAHHNTGLDSSKHYWAEVPCSLCKGEKQVTAMVLANVVNGQSMRRHMQKHRLTLSDAAKINGISVSEMSSVLCGRKSLADAVGGSMP